jgi:hypothetical protein
MSEASSSDEKELELFLSFIKVLRPGGIVASTLRPIAEELQKTLSKSAIPTTLTSSYKETDGSQVPALLFVALHKFMLTYGFICVIESPSTVPGFAAPIRGTPFLLVFQRKLCIQNIVYKRILCIMYYLSRMYIMPFISIIRQNCRLGNFFLIDGMQTPFRL